VNQAMNDGVTPLLVASADGHDEIVKLLESIGAI
jgi:ankyrin repeat protein